MKRNHDPKFLEYILNDLGIPGVKFTVSQDLTQLAFVVDVVMERAFSTDSMEIDHNSIPDLKKLLLHRLEFVVTRLQNDIKSRKGV